MKLLTRRPVLNCGKVILSEVKNYIKNANSVQVNLEKYNEIILDFDGVILDSNKIKERAIKNATKKYLSHEKKDEFSKYFVLNNGLPRELKISRFFNKETTEIILARYNNILESELKKADFTYCLELFLNKLRKMGIKPLILSGGDFLEITKLLKARNKLDYFSKIYGGPKTKSQNVKSIKFRGRVLFIGDSLVDYQTAKKCNFDFVFMYRYSQFLNWKKYFIDKDNVIIIKDLTDILNV